MITCDNDQRMYFVMNSGHASASSSCTIFDELYAPLHAHKHSRGTGGLIRLPKKGGEGHSCRKVVTLHAFQRNLGHSCTSLSPKHACKCLRLRFFFFFTCIVSRVMVFRLIKKEKKITKEKKCSKQQKYAGVGRYDVF